MAKKREWKAWMVVGTDGKPAFPPVYESCVHSIKKRVKDWANPGERIIRVRIVEDK